jgi:hypothetical protein
MQAIDAELFGVQSAYQVLASSQRWLPVISSASTEARPGIAEHGRQLHRRPDSTGQQRLNTLKPFGDPLPQLPLSAKVRRVFDTGEPVISDFSLLPISQSAITLEVPVFSNGKVIYSLAMGIFADRLGDILRQQNLPPDWITAIYDNSGTIAARRKPEQYVGERPASFLRTSAEVRRASPSQLARGHSCIGRFQSVATVGLGHRHRHPEDRLTENLWRSMASTPP